MEEVKKIENPFNRFIRIDSYVHRALVEVHFQGRRWCIRERVLDYDEAWRRVGHYLGRGHDACVAPTGEGDYWVLESLY